MRIAFLLGDNETGGGPAMSPATSEVVNRLRARGAQVELIQPGCEAIDIATIRPRHDLYVLKVKSPITLSLAGALTIGGANVVNSYRASSLVRDKVATTAILAAAGVPVPASWATGDPGRVAGLAGPLWLKPARGSRGAGVRRVAQPAEFAAEAAPADPYGLPLPLFVQAEAPSAGRDVKTYVVGDRVFGLTRPWPAASAADKEGCPLDLDAPIVAAALQAGRVLGLEIYGVDFMVSGNRFAVVDVNAYPGFKGVTAAARYLSDYLFARAELAPPRCAVTLRASP